MSWVDIGAADLEDGELRDVVSGDLHLGVARQGDAWHAFEVWCTHEECPLTEGWLEGGAVRCACHGALFDLATGEPLDGPADQPIRIFDTREVDGRVESQLPTTDT
ncbi:MAG: Rieske 2Fe-2S domain-containing protein [Gaiellaceae bacterium]